MSIFEGSTTIGTIELEVTDRTAAAVDLKGWKKRIRRMNRAEREAEEERRKTEVRLSDVRIPDSAVITPLRSEDHEPSRGPARDETQAQIDAMLAEASRRSRFAFWLEAKIDLASRERGTPGNTAPKGGKTCGE